MISQGAAGLLLDPGLGKTSISLAASKILFNHKLIKGVLVIAPLRAVHNVWPAEIKKWQDFHKLTWVLVHGSEKDRLAALNTKAHFYFMNPENVKWLFEVMAPVDQMDWPFDVLIVDESTKFKAANTQRFKALRPFLGRFKRRYILTGTPAPNGLIDLFGQMFILDQGVALGRFITGYRNTYFYPSGFMGYQWSPQPDAMARITERIAPLSMRMRVEDYLTLPTLVNDYRWLALPQEARDLYKQVEDHFIAELGNSLILAPNAAAAGVKCRQILNGAVYTTEGAKDWEHIHDAKLDALEDLVEELEGQPLLLLYEFIHDKVRLQERFPQFGVIGGQTMAKDQKVIDAFNHGHLAGVLGHPASMGHALNLQGACAHVCWFGLTWNLEFYDQAIRRVWRQGNEAQRVVIHHLCIRNSLDESVVDALAAKDRTQRTLTESIRLHNS